MERNRDSSLEDLGFRSFSERLHEDVFITSKGSINVHDMRQSSSSLNKPLRIDGNPLIPRRGVVPNDPKVINVIDELQKITVPVQMPKNGSNEQYNQHGKSSESLADPVQNVYADKHLGDQVSYAQKVKSNAKPLREVNFRKMHTVESHQEADIVIPKEVVKTVRDRFDNVLFGYFLGNRLPFPVVEYYVKNVWSKFGRNE
ncbi:hypothetical protein HanRHA438_Chr12g0569171 [Helianthus annuus]|nr:hypothetical protein HanRHA438_Chr12g0569171 [Helianthus annuus]